MLKSRFGRLRLSGDSKICTAAGGHAGAGDRGVTRLGDTNIDGACGGAMGACAQKSLALRPAAQRGAPVAA
eukprot:6197691-Prymnesium_polylepis.1